MQNRAAFLAVIKEGKILLVKSKTQAKYEDKWSIPGGLVESGESDEAGAEREVLEETGIVSKAGSLLKTLGQDTNLIVNIFRAEYISGELKIEESEIHEAKWVDILELKTLDLAYTLAEDLSVL